MILRSLIRGHLPLFGTASQGLRVRPRPGVLARCIDARTERTAGPHVLLSVWGREQIKSIDGAQLRADGSIEETFPAASGATETQSRRGPFISQPSAETKALKQPAPREVSALFFLAIYALPSFFCMSASVMPLVSGQMRRKKLQAIMTEKKMNG